MNYIVSDELLYQYMPVAEAAILSELEKSAEENPHVFSSKFQHRMQKLLRDEKRSPVMRTFLRGSKHVAIVALVLLTVALTITMSVEALRNRFLQVVTQLFERYTSISFSIEGETDEDILKAVESDVIPEGYVETECFQSDYELFIVYANEAGEEILYHQLLMTTGEYVYDSEQAKLSELMIGDIMVAIAEKNGRIHLVWMDEKNLYNLMGYGEKEDLISMAKNIIEKI